MNSEDTTGELLGAIMFEDEIEAVRSKPEKLTPLTREAVSAA
jgi:hypothetical protein